MSNYTTAKAISIHALHGEGDEEHRRACASFADFNPRPPRGGRLDDVEDGDLTHVISIHALHGEGDALAAHLRAYHAISIHALHGEGDLKGDYIMATITIFQSTPSTGRATLNQIN